MSDLVEAVKLLLFLKTVLITNDPVDIDNEWVSIEPKSALVAINDGASIQIDVSNLLESFDWEGAKLFFPEGTVEGRLTSTNGMNIGLASRGTAHAGESVYLIVRPIEPIPLGTEFTRVLLRSSRPISSADVYWKNGSK